MKDRSYAAYHDFAEAKSTEPVPKSLAMAGRYQKLNDTLEPIAHRGCTVVCSLKHPASALDCVAYELDAVSDVALVPVTSWHETLADGLSGQQWDTTAPALQARLLALLNDRLANQRNARPLAGTVSGVGLLGSAIVGFVSHDRPTYQRITELRASIFGDPEIRRYGIRQRFEFCGHVTVGYFEGMSSEALSVALAAIRNAWEPLRVEFDDPRLCVFSDMSHYTPVRFE